MALPTQACIDQEGDINKSLKALPIFLLASKQFVVFVGDSYFRRMWCMLELFTFVRSGGSLDAVVLKPLLPDAAESAIKQLDINKADCYVRADKQRILAIVEASFGSSIQFNAACRQILVSKLSGAAKYTKSSKAVETSLWSRTGGDVDSVTV